MTEAPWGALIQVEWQQVMTNPFGQVAKIVRASALGGAILLSALHSNAAYAISVSYTHLTLPTTSRV